MNTEELIAKKYLLSIGFENIIYEPDGNVPPDFLVNDSIAIEVRRLNKQIKGSDQGKPQPIEKLNYQLIPKINNLLIQYQNVEFNHSAYVIISYGRPLNPSKKLLNQVKKNLDFYLNNLIDRTKIQINRNLYIELIPTIKKYDSAYVLGIIDDNDTGGPVVSDVFENLKIVVKEKNTKISKYLPKYKIWWLILIDYIGFMMDEYEFNQLKKISIDQYNFKKIILIPFNNHNIGRIL